MKIKALIKLTTCFYLPLLIFLLDVCILLPFGIYTLFNWLDIPIHFLGGMSIAYSCILVLRKVKDKVIINDRFFEILIIVALVGLSAILWELSEYLWGFNLKIEDTLFDLFMGLVGGLTVSSFIKIK